MKYDVKNIYDILAEAPEDKLTGVKLVRLSCGESVSLFAAELESGAVLREHYHLKGDVLSLWLSSLCPDCLGL